MSSKVMTVILLSLLLVLSFTSVVNASAKYIAVCDSAFCRIIEGANQEISDLKKSVDEGALIPQLGQKADKICNSAIERFAAEAPLPDDDKGNEGVYDKKIEDLEKCLDAPLHVVYLKQLSLLRDKTLKNFKTALTATEGTEFDAMMQADDFFRREAEDATRQNPDWDYSSDIQHLKSSLGEIATRSRKLQDVKLSAAKQTQQAMQYLQQQQQQMQAIQQQLAGGTSPWNIGAAYRVPDTNINLSCTYQQGRANIVLNCVPDESAPLLGPNGFVNGVTPGNLGLSFNINM